MTREACITAVLLGLTAGMAVADTLVATRNIASRSVVTAADLAIMNTDVQGALSRMEDAIGLEARVTLYAGRPLRPGDLGPPAIVERNQIVKLQFQSTALTIETDGRALDRAPVGSRIRVMNLSSRAVVVGEVLENGMIRVGR